MFGLGPRKELFTRYAERIISRPSFQRIAPPTLKWRHGTPPL